MKKKILALGLALTLTFAMSITVSAAGSVTADSVASSTTTAAPATTTADPALATATQQFDEATIAEFATTTTVASADVNVVVSKVSTDTVKSAISQAKVVVGDNAFIASVVDISVPAGTQKATITLNCPNVWVGQSVTILHQKADGSWESITPDAVGNNTVTFTMTSFSPVAIVINATAPKTGDVVMMVAIMAILGLAATAVCSKKAQA